MHQEFSHTKRDTALTNPDVTEGMNKVLTQQHPVRVSLCLKKKKRKKKDLIYMCLIYAAHIEANTCAHA